jgi:hypothetical protein
MQNVQDAVSAEIWRAAQHRRIEGIPRPMGPVAKSPTIEIGRRILIKPRLGSLRGLIIAAITFSALATVSATVHAGRAPQILLRATGPMIRMPLTVSQPGHCLIASKLSLRRIP